MQESLRQGDVSLVKIDSLPVSSIEEKNDGKSIVLAYGTVTGHSHAIYENMENVKVFSDGKVKFLEVKDQVILKHEEHSPATIDAGIYKIPVQIEYSPQELRITRD